MDESILKTEECSAAKEAARVLRAEEKILILKGECL
jgi:hypothetical protein